jgi:hypothetical protein
MSAGSDQDQPRHCLAERSKDQYLLHSTFLIGRLRRRYISELNLASAL